MATLRYRRTSESYRKLLSYLYEYQKEAGVAPTSRRQIGRALGLSHTQVGRLMRKAVVAGLLEVSPGGQRYSFVRSPPTTAGLSWIPRVQCSWTKGIKWVRDEQDGVWLDRAVYGIKIGAERWLWALTFPDSKVDRGAGFLKLNDRAMALVRRCNTDEMHYNWWYLVERRNREVLVSTLHKKVQGRWIFRVSARDENPVRIYPDDIVRVSEILMVTMRPSPPSPSRPRRA